MHSKFKDEAAVNKAIELREEFMRVVPKNFPLKEHIEYVKYLKDMRDKNKQK